MASFRPEIVHLGAAVSSNSPSSSGAESVTSLMGVLRPLSSQLLASLAEVSKGGLGGPISQSSVSRVIIINSASLSGKTRCSYGVMPSSLSATASSMPADTLLFMVVVLLLLKVRLRRFPGRSDERVDIDEGVDDDSEEGTEVGIDEAAGIDAVVGR